MKIQIQILPTNYSRLIIVHTDWGLARMIRHRQSKQPGKAQGSLSIEPLPALDNRSHREHEVTEYQRRKPTSQAANQCTGQVFSQKSSAG
jgi:hypothetical protein